jgi:DNA-directed RNA polymerases I, II, and III subunit RPABC1
MSLQTVGNLGEDASKLYRVRKTCNKMLAKRGYIVPEEDLEGTTEQFTEKFGENPSRDALTILAVSREDASDKMFVFFPEDESVGRGPISVYAQRMETEQVKRGIIVVKGTLTGHAKDAIKEMRSGASARKQLEYFSDNELLVDITEHTLVPEHIVLTPQEKKQLLTRYRLKPTQLPKIQVTDPIARYYGLSPKQVVKIVRSSETAGRYVTYRICT